MKTREQIIADEREYQVLVHDLKSATNPDEILRIWERIEQIKNEYGGHPPKP
jgi:hypothetical protein